MARLSTELFGLVEYHGLAYLEVKRDEGTGEYFIIEPNIAGIRITHDSVDNIVFNNLVISPNPIVDEVGGNKIDKASNITEKTAGNYFVDKKNKNLHLKEKSKAIDKGINEYEGVKAPQVDKEGNLRPQLDGYDIGAYEF